MLDSKSLPDHNHNRILRVWLLAAAAMIVATLLVGGATRLTESGLSITEWKPVTGLMPPLSQEEWQNEFVKYQAIPQFRELHSDMDLAQFKVIYWWEWTHRLLARSTGMVFLLPFVFFLWRGWVPRALQFRLWGIFAAGGALGAVGWWMVSSGLAGSGRVSVSQYRLAFHLTLACAIYAAILWTAQQLEPRESSKAPTRMRASAMGIAILVLGQIYLGALVAGSDAGLIYNTWPLIDGSIIPDTARLWFVSPAWRNIFEHTLTIQFDHRMLAYAIWVLCIWHLYDAWRNQCEVRGAFILACAVSLQVALGIATLLSQVALPLALAHQLIAVFVFTVATVHAERLSSREVFTVLRATPVNQTT
jgi:cytochrome c oxidase assembly protein subunit 15